MANVERVCEDPQLPRITVVTPSYNQAEYLEETIHSVLEQGYPNLEYIIIDGGSTDGSVEIIRRYERRLAYWVSEADGGQAHAVNKGFRRATGEWVGWQNSDDTYEPGAFVAVARAGAEDPGADVLYGRTLLSGPDNRGGEWASVHPEFRLEDMVPLPFVFNQSAFFRQRVIDRGLYLDPGKRHMMDYDYMWRLALAGCRFRYVDGLAGRFRQQPDSKTASPEHAAVGCEEFLDIYCMLYHHARFPAGLRPRVVRGFRGQCANDWAHRRYAALGRDVERLVGLVGVRGLTPGLALRYLLARFLPGQCERLRAMARSRREGRGR